MARMGVVTWIGLRSRLVFSLNGEVRVGVRGRGFMGKSGSESSFVHLWARTTKTPQTCTHPRHLTRVSTSLSSTSLPFTTRLSRTGLGGDSAGKISARGVCECVLLVWHTFVMDRSNGRKNKIHKHSDCAKKQKYLIRVLLHSLGEIVSKSVPRSAGLIGVSAPVGVGVGVDRFHSDSLCLSYWKLLRLNVVERDWRDVKY